MPQHTVELERNGRYWNVILNGQRVLELKSHAVAELIVQELRHPGCHWPSEAYEVAASIRKWAEGDES